MMLTRHANLNSLNGQQVVLNNLLSKQVVLNNLLNTVLIPPTE